MVGGIHTDLVFNSVIAIPTEYDHVAGVQLRKCERYVLIGNRFCRRGGAVSAWPPKM